MTQFVFAAAMMLPLPALAQNQNCPNGAWFCEQVEVGVGVQIPNLLPPPQVRPAQPPPVVVEELPPSAPPPPRRHTQPPVVVYQPAPATQTRVIIITPGYGPAYGPPQGYYPPPQPVSRRLAPPVKARPVWHSEFGLNMRVEGTYVGHPDNTDYSTGLGGIGLSLRYRPVPAFAFDLGVDVLGGTDYNGFHRTEVPFSLSGLVYVNPRSRAQLYFNIGMDYSRATVRSDNNTPLLSADFEEPGTFSQHYSYFGGHGGLGIEFRISKRVAFNVDGLAFVRKRVDDAADAVPEFVDRATGRTTNTSGGGLFRGGLTLWW
ncbi:MAG: outer membrane beta-barrel protein [Minicystis sp.]